MNDTEVIVDEGSGGHKSTIEIYIVEPDQFRVFVYDYEGNFLRALNYPGSLPDREDKIIIRGIAADGEFIYLLSTGDNAICCGC